MNILDNPEIKQLIVDGFLFWRDKNDSNKNITLDGQAERKNSFYEFIYSNFSEHSLLESLSKEEKSKSLRIASNKIFNERQFMEITILVQEKVKIEIVGSQKKEFIIKTLKDN